MVTFYSILKSVYFDKLSGKWLKFNPKTQPSQDTEDLEAYHLVNFRLDTGKKHQIRLAASLALNSPILGDFKMGYDPHRMSTNLLRRSLKFTKLQERKMFEKGICLHSRKLQVPVSVDSEEFRSFDASFRS